MEEQQDQQTENVAEFIKPCSDKVTYERGAKLCVVEIDSRVALAAIPGGNIVSQGVHRYQIAERDLPIVKAQERSDEDRKLFAQSAERYQLELRRRIENDDALIEFQKKGDLEAFAKREESIRDSYGGSPEACMRRDFDRDQAPFESVRVIAKGIDAPADVEKREAEQTAAEVTATLVANAVAKALTPLASASSTSSAEQIAAAVSAAMAPVVAALVAAQNSKKGSQ